MEFTPKFIKQVMDKRSSEIITAEEWNAIINLLIQQGDHNSEFLKTVADSNSTTEEVKQFINDAVFNTENADMCKVVYDKNDDGIVDLAEEVVENSIKTVHLQNGVVTNAKLSDTINARLDYLYTNVTRLLILIGAQSEIEGSEDLVLFGLDGKLGEAYNADLENTRQYLNNLVVTDTLDTIEHTDVSITDKVKTDRIYNVTDTNIAHNTKISEVTNASLKVDSNSCSVVYGSYETCEVHIAYLEDNYYAVCTWGWVNYNDDKPHNKIFVIYHDPASKQFSIVHTSEHAREYDGLSMIDVIGGYGYWRSDRWGSSRDYIGWYCISKEGIVTQGATLNDAYTNAGFADGYSLRIETSSSTRTVYKYTKSGGYSTIYTATSSCSIKALSGYWALLKIATAYYLYNVKYGISKSITQAVYDSYNNIVRSQTLDTFYMDGYRYTIDDTGTITKHEFIENYVKGTHTQKISDTEELIYTHSRGSSVYKIIRRPGQNSECIELFNTQCLADTIQAENANAKPDHFAVSPDLSTVLYGVDFGRSTSAIVRQCSLTKGIVKLATPLEEPLQQPIFIIRQQNATLSANETKQIFIRPETKENTFNSVNLIVYLDRALTDTDLLKVEIVHYLEDDSWSKEELVVLESSPELTKYYNYLYTEATSNIEILVTIKTGDTALQITQILGGVDNAV
jgi:hypothetical protein